MFGLADSINAALGEGCAGAVLHLLLATGADRTRIRRTFAAASGTSDLHMTAQD